jgi:hypothetical protein
MSDSEPEFSPTLLAYEAACATYEVARVSLKVTQANYEEKRLNFHRVKGMLVDLIHDEPDSRVGDYPHMEKAIKKADTLLQAAVLLLDEAENSFERAVQLLKGAHQAFMEEEAMVACASMFAFDAEKCLQPHHQVQLFIFSLLRRGDSPKVWNLEHNDPALKRLALRQLLSMAGIPQEF